MRQKVRTPDERLAWIAARNHAIVTREQLLAAELTEGEIRQRLEAGVLIARYRGVYRVAAAPASPESEYLAAVRACGPDAVTAGLSGAWLHGVLGAKPPPPTILAPTERRVPGAVRRAVDPRDRCVVNRIPATTVPYTLIDLAAELSPDELARAFHRAGARYGIAPRQIDRALSRRHWIRGARNLRLVLGREAQVLLSRLERAFIALLKRHGLPLPETNRLAGAHYVDCRWPGHSLSAELDSFRFHNSRRAWEESYARERAAKRRGETWRRYTWFDVVEDPEPTVVELRELLLGG